MTWTPPVAIILLIIFGATDTFTILFRTDRAGLFRKLERGAFEIFDADEPMGKPQDQLFAPIYELAPGVQNEDASDRK